MAGSTSSASATPEDPAPASRGSKRGIEQVSDSLLRNRLEDLVARKDKNVPLTVRAITCSMLTAVAFRLIVFWRRTFAMY